MIKVTSLSKEFGDIKAVDNVNFSIQKGEIYGLLGPNGAGKSTIINMLSTIIKSDQGSIHIDGYGLHKNHTLCKQSIGVVPQEVSLYDEFSAFDNLIFWGKLYDIPSIELKARINTILELIGLFERRNDAVSTYSGGMKRRVNIAAALLHQPKVLLMDEPTVGVDPQSRNRIFEIVEDLNAQGMTIIYTTHYMEEVERLCNRIAIIDNGRIIGQGTQEELQKLAQVKEAVAISFDALSKEQEDLMLDKFQAKFDRENCVLHVECDVNKELSKIITTCTNYNIEIKDIELKKVNLESVFLNLTGKQLRD